MNFQNKAQKEEWLVERVAMAGTHVMLSSQQRVAKNLRENEFLKAQVKLSN